MELHTEDRWIIERLDILTPQWQSNVEGAHAALHRRIELRSWPRWMTVSVAVAAACVALAVMPQARALAQEAWLRLTLERIDVIRVNLSKLPVETHITMDGAARTPATVEEAAQLAGFAVD